MAAYVARQAEEVDAAAYPDHKAFLSSFIENLGLLNEQ
jgi:hypothetical protein